MPTTHHQPTDARRVVVTVLGLTLLLGVLLMAFALPATHTGAHGVPVGVVGDDATAAVVAERLDGFEVTVYPTDADARAAILDREVYGALEPAADGSVIVLVATAASYSASQLVQQAGAGMAAAQGGTADVVELRALPDGDPRGAGLAAGALPLALGGWIGAVVIMLVAHSARARAVAVVGFSVVGGLGLTAVLQYVVGTLDGSFWFTALGAVLGVAATALAVTGLRTLLGGPGLAIAAVLLVLLGNPLSGLMSAPEMLPSPWGALGQLLPPGATGSLLRDLAYFDGAGAAHAVWVLVAWLALGVVLLVLAHLRERRHPADDHLDETLEAALEGRGR